MDLKQLEYFVKVAEAEGFTRAAERLNVAQSALSRQIKLLEEELDVPLIIRRKRGTQLTAAGARLVEQSQGLLRYVQQMREMVTAEATEPRGELAVGFPVALARAIGTAFVVRMRAKYSKVLVKTFVGTSPVMNDMLVNGLVDLAVIGSRRARDLIEARQIRPGELHLIGAKRKFKDFGRTVGIEDMLDLPLIAQIPRSYPFPVLEAAARERNTSLDIVTEVQHVELLSQLASTGIGYAIAPLDFIRSDLKNGLIESRPIRDMPIGWLIARQKAKAVSPAMRVAEDLIRELLLSSGKPSRRA